MLIVQFISTTRCSRRTSFLCRIQSTFFGALRFWVRCSATSICDLRWYSIWSFATVLHFWTLQCGDQHCTKNFTKRHFTSICSVAGTFMQSVAKQNLQQHILWKAHTSLNSFYTSQSTSPSCKWPLCNAQCAFSSPHCIVCVTCIYVTNCSWTHARGSKFKPQSTFEWKYFQFQLDM